jgi:hypothetical protein
LIGRHAVAPLRPRPFGPPLRGRATLRNGMTTGGPERLPGHETERVGFHLRNAARWSKIGGRRRTPPFERDVWEPRAPLLKLHGSVEDQQIVLPTWNKGIRESILDTWRVAYRALSEANYWRFIGFSLPESDSYVKFLLKAAISDAEHLKGIDVLCLDPAQSVRRRFGDFVEFRDYRFVDAPVEDYLRSLSDKQDTQAEKLDSGAGARKAMRYKALEDFHDDWFVDRI